MKASPKGPAFCWRQHLGVTVWIRRTGLSHCSFESQQAWVIKATRRRHTPPLHARLSKFQCSLNASRTTLLAWQDSPERQKRAFWSSALRNDWRALFLGFLFGKYSITISCYQIVQFLVYLLQYVDVPAHAACFADYNTDLI